MDRRKFSWEPPLNKGSATADLIFQDPIGRSSHTGSSGGNDSLATPSPPDIFHKDGDAGDCVGGRSRERIGENNQGALKQAWRQFLCQWDQPILRTSVADSIPDLVGVLWHEEFLLLDKPIAFERILISPADRGAIELARRLMRTLLHQTRVTSMALLLALLLARRFRQKQRKQDTRADGGPAGSQYQFFVICLVLAHKYTEDHPYSNRVWCQLTGLPIGILNQLERELLQRLNYCVAVQPEELQRWVVALDLRFGWTFISLEHYNEYRTLPLPPIPDIPIITRPRAARLRNSFEGMAIVPSLDATKNLASSPSSLHDYHSPSPLPDNYLKLQRRGSLEGGINGGFPVMAATSTRRRNSNFIENHDSTTFNL